MNSTRKTGLKLAIAFTATMFFFDVIQGVESIFLRGAANFFVILVVFEVIVYFEKKVKK